MEASKSLCLLTFLMQHNTVCQSVGITGGQAGRNSLQDLLLHDEHLHNVRSLKSNYPCVCVCVCDSVLLGLIWKVDGCADCLSLS